ncbi:esterase/lipase family protein [Kitasatospora sp. NPDC089509]|uniref:esterase/lipase family protein n=1 Tax=Kitasatospora sp. NPDC089509 TaxID=3364079 RepID=UPI003824A914
MAEGKSTRKRRLASVAVWTAATSLAVGTAVFGGIANATTPESVTVGAKPTIVLEHGAFADASSWDGVIERLRADGYPVVAAADPLRGPASDTAALRSVIDHIPGPQILVGHS